MKKFSVLLLLLVFGVSATWAVNSPNKKKFEKLSLQEVDAEFLEQLQVNTVEDFLSLTPKKFKERTGKKLGIKNAIRLKAAQKMVKKRVKADNSDIPEGLYIVGAILGFAWILMGVMDDWDGKNWWMSLLLFALCWLPGVIHAFAKKKEYY